MLTLKAIIGGLFVIAGLFFAIIATLGLYRLDYVLNRMHAAAKCDTLSLTLTLVGLIILMEPSFIIFKFILIAVFVWVTSPIAVHMISRVEYETDPFVENKAKVVKK